MEVSGGTKGLGVQGGSESPEGLGSSKGPESHTVLEVDLEGSGSLEGSGGSQGSRFALEAGLP